MLVRCMGCEALNELDRNWIDAEDACKYCGSKGRWRKDTDPRIDYVLNENDKRMLKTLRIASE